MNDEPAFHGSAKEAQLPPGRARHRPLGVTALALLSGAASLLILVAGVLLVATSTFSRDTLFMGMVMFLLFSGIYGACAVGLWRLQNWARWALIVISAILGVRGFPLATIVGIPVIVYLVNSRTVRAFHAPMPTGTEVPTEDAS